jgi:hypothetical protein
MKIGDRVSTNTSDDYDGYEGKIVWKYTDGDYLEYDVLLDHNGLEIAFSEDELEVIDNEQA